MNALFRNVRYVTNVVGNALTKQGGFVVTTRTAAFKSDLKIRWIRPPTIQQWKPEKSCDDGIELNIKPQDYCNYFNQSKELEDADEIVKRMFTLEFARRKETQNAKREAILAMVQRHKADRGSMESRIACMTAEILDLQTIMPHNTTDKKMKNFLIQLIAKRKKFLTHLRRWDYKRFVWLLHKLNLVYKPYPRLWLNISRKGSLRRLTRLHCEKVKREKTRAYRRELHEEKKIFFAEKVGKLEFIRSEEIACGTEPTVTEEDIEEAKKIAARLNTRRREFTNRVRTVQNKTE